MSRPVRIVVDRTSNIDPKTRERLGIEVLPITITNLPPEVSALLAQEDYEGFYNFLEHAPGGFQPGTQAGSVWEIREVLERVIKRDDCDIVCLVLSGGLSAVYENTLQSAKELARQYPNRIVVIPEQAFLSLSLLARASAEYAQSNKGIDEVLAFIEDKLGRGFVAGVVLDLTRLRRSGRVPIPAFLNRVLKPVLNLFGIMPMFILEQQSRPRLLSLVRKRRLADYVINAIKERVGFREPMLVGVGYTGSETLTEAKRLQEIISNHPDFVLAQPVALEQASPVIGVHAGKALLVFGALGLGYDSLPTSVLIKSFATIEEELNRLRRVVNAINVFPVRDGDTGSNLFSALRGAHKGIEPTLPVSEALNQVVRRIAQQGGGYSGGAIAAYLLGFSSYVERCETGPELKLASLVSALKAGTERCYEYFGADAKEGTILSVMRASAEAAEKAFAQRPTFRNVLVQAYLAATDELLNPRIQEVEVLRAAGMVDAGGFGFTIFLWALLRTLGLTRDAKLQERYRLVLKEVRRHAELGQRLIYRRQPLELRGFCVEGCVQGDVKEDLRQAFSALNNRLPNPKMTFNVVDGTTHFHIHVSEGLEEEVLSIAGRFGYALPPKPPTRLAKRRREIYQFRFVNFFTKFRRIPGYIVSFFANWVAYTVFFPVMWARAHRQVRTLRSEIATLRLVQSALAALLRDEKSLIVVLDNQMKVLFANRLPPATKPSLEGLFPAEVARGLRLKIEEMTANREHFLKWASGGWQFEIELLNVSGATGFLIKCPSLLY